MCFVRRRNIVRLKVKFHLLPLLLFITSSLIVRISEVSAQQDNHYISQIDTATNERYQKFESNFNEFIQNIDKSLKLRQDAKLLFKALDSKLRNNEPIRTDDQRTLLYKFTQFRDDRDHLEALVNNYNGYSDSNRVFKYPVINGSSTEIAPDSFETTDQILINPEDDYGKLITLEIKMWLAAKLMIIDNYAVIVLRYQNNADLRRQFDADTINPEIKAFLTEVTDTVLENEKYNRISKIIRLVQQIRDYEIANPQNNFVRGKVNSYLNTLIENSYAYHRIPGFSLMDKLSHQSDELQNKFFDNTVWLGDQVTFQLSMIFGNAIGTYQSRQGKMIDVPVDKISNDLELLDILLEKTPFRLTDNFIPGHWGHVAIWVGDKSTIPELKRLGVWGELPEIEAEIRQKEGYKGESFQALIEQDRGVLEALRPGVELNTLEHFLNIDDLAVIRLKNLDDFEKREYLINAFKQIGKAYDFNFNVETHREIVCSELAFVVFDDVEWPVERSIGRFTVSPDHIAVLAKGNEAPLEPILIYHDGIKLPSQYLQHNLQSLLEENYNKVILHPKSPPIN